MGRHEIYNISLHLTRWGRVTHICASQLPIIGSDNGLSPGRRQVIIWTNAGILLIWTLGTNFSGISSEIQAFPFKKMHLKMSSAKWRPFYLGLNVLTTLYMVVTCVLSLVDIGVFYIFSQSKHEWIHTNPQNIVLTPLGVNHLRYVGVFRVETLSAELLSIAPSE